MLDLIFLSIVSWLYSLLEVLYVSKIWCIHIVGWETAPNMTVTTKITYMFRLEDPNLNLHFSDWRGFRIPKHTWQSSKWMPVKTTGVSLILHVCKRLDYSTPPKKIRHLGKVLSCVFLFSEPNCAPGKIQLWASLRSHLSLFWDVITACNKKQWIQNIQRKMTAK